MGTDGKQVKVILASSGTVQLVLQPLPCIIDFSKTLLLIVSASDGAGNF
jgi:hypothetical protein